VRILSAQVPFRWMVPPLQLGDPIRSMWFPSHLPLEGTGSYLDFLAVIDDPWYKTLTVAPEPSVEQVPRAIHLMGGRIGTHM
jgi:hypothetical protein